MIDAAKIIDIALDVSSINFIGEKTPSVSAKSWSWKMRMWKHVHRCCVEKPKLYWKTRFICIR